MLGGGRNPAVLRRRNGADDETTRRAVEGDGEEDHLVGGGRDHRGDATGRCGGGGSGLEKDGYSGLADRRKGKPSEQRVPLATRRGGAAAVPGDVLRPEHPALPREAAGRARDRVELHLGAEGAARSGAGGQAAQAGTAPAKAAAAADAGMLLHIDGSKHQWFNDDRWYDLIVILDDATSEIYYAQLVEEESTRTVMAGLREVIEDAGLVLRAVQRPGEPLLRDGEGRGEGG